MTGLHTLGYRPKPGERVRASGAGCRGLWVGCYQHMREHGRPDAVLAFDFLALACLAARDAVYPDALFEAYVARQDARRAARAS